MTKPAGERAAREKTREGLRSTARCVRTEISHNHAHARIFVFEPPSSPPRGAVGSTTWRGRQLGGVINAFRRAVVVVVVMEGQTKLEVVSKC